jgi:CRP-like cAMP-binding protein
MNPDPSSLSKVPLFAGLSDDDRDRLASWLEVEEFPAGKRLAREGEYDYAFFILDDGRARVEHEGQALRNLGPGDVFGEIAFFGDGRRSATVVAESDVRVLTMFGTRFREMQAKLPEVATRIENLVRERSGPTAEA